MIATLALAGAHLLFFLGSTFAALALAQVLLAVGIAFNSGTDTSFHYESLDRLGRKREYAEREARASGNAFRGGAAATLLGGFAGSLKLNFPYFLKKICHNRTFY